MSEDRPPSDDGQFDSRRDGGPEASPPEGSDSPREDTTPGGSETPPPAGDDDTTADGVPADRTQADDVLTGGPIERDPVEEEDDLWGLTYGGQVSQELTFEETLQTLAPEARITHDLRWEDLREHYGPLRSLFKLKEAAYRSLQRQLTQAWINDTYDRFLVRIVSRMLRIFLAGVVISVLLGGTVLGVGVLGSLPPSVAGTAVSTTWLAGVVTLGGVVGSAGVAIAYWAFHRVVRVRVRIAKRRREIDYNLPYAVTFMYALTAAGVGFDRTIERLADSTGTYGAVAQEFDRVVREVEMFGNNLHVGMANLREITPSDELRGLVDDINTVLDSGGDLASFLREEVDRQVESAIATQETYLDQLELLSEVFVVGFVAAPLFTLVVLLVISFLGGNLVPIIAGLVYFAIPLSLVGFFLLIDFVSQPFTSGAVSSDEWTTLGAPPADAARPAWADAYLESSGRRPLGQRLRARIRRVSDDPWRGLAFTVPVAAVVVVLEVATGVVPVAVAAMLERPVLVTTGLVVVTLVVALAPIAAVYERNATTRRQIRDRFPTVLELLATSNRRGLSLTRGLAIVSESTTGVLSEELARLRNDIRWNADVPAAFAAFGDRLEGPALTRTVHLLAEGSRVTSDLQVVLTVAARDVGERVRLDRERRQTLQTYLVIVVVGFLVYLLVVLLLADNFLGPIEQFAVGAAEATEAPISLGAVPVAQLRVLLYHSALIQGFGSGILAGKLVDNTLYSGLKYGLALVGLTTIVFALS